MRDNLKSRLLQLYPVFRELPELQLDDLLANAKYIYEPMGEILMDEEQPCRGFALTLSGYIRVIKASVNGRELHLYSVGPGDSCILSSICLLGKGAYNARAVVKQDVELVVISPSTFKTLYSQYEPFREQIVSSFAEHLMELTQLVSAVAFQKLDQRLAALLTKKPRLIHCTHQMLAEELGSVRVIVSRLLKNFADQGWVSLGREQIEIIDVAALERFSEL